MAAVAVVLGLALLGFPSPAQALSAPGFIHKALFHLDEGTGTATAEAVSSRNACVGATVANPCPSADPSSPAWTTRARYGSALLFDGLDDTVTFEHAASLNWASGDNVVTLEAWILPTGPGTIVSKGVPGTSILLRNGKVSTTGGDHNYRFGIDASGNVIFSYSDTDGRLREVRSPFGTGQGAPVSFNQWHWISVGFSQNLDQVTIRLDGGRNDMSSTNVLDKKPGAPAPRTNTRPISIGSFGGGHPFFQGIIDELRITVTPDGWLGGTPQVGSDRGLVLSRVEFSPTSGNEFFEIFRPDLGDGAPAISLRGARIVDRDQNYYEVPSSGAGCVNGDLSCYEVSPGETVRIWLNGAGPAMDTLSTTVSEWFTSNAFGTLGDGGGSTDLGGVDFLKIRTTGDPKDPDNVRALLNEDVVVWGGDQSTNPFLLPMVTPEGLWPTANAFVSTTLATTGIQLITPGDNLAGPPSWRTIP